MRNVIGAVEGLRLLMKGHRLALMTRLAAGRYKVFLKYFEQYDVSFDAVYVDTRKDDSCFQDYTQIMKDFSISPDRMLSRVIVPNPSPQRYTRF